MCPGSMTPGSREGIGVDGGRIPSRKPEGCDEEENGEQTSEERSTKGDDGGEILNPSTTGLSPGLAPVLPASPPNRTGSGNSQNPQTSAEPTPACHDQHHFLRSSVRPPSKRIRKDSAGSAINGHGGAKSKGTTTLEKRVHRWVQLGICFNLWACLLIGYRLCLNANSEILADVWVDFWQLQQTDWNHDAKEFCDQEESPGLF